MRIVYLYRQVMPYNEVVFEEFRKDGVELLVFKKSKKLSSPYHPKRVDWFEYRNYEDYTGDQIFGQVIDFSPDVLFVCDWSIRKFNRVAQLCRKKLGIPVVVGCDTQFVGGKQWLNVVSAPFRHRKFFTHIMVAGYRQYEYALKLGFNSDQIKFGLYACDRQKFSSIQKKSSGSPSKTFLFVGRMTANKGVDMLIDLWDRKFLNKHKLIMVGQGDLTTYVMQKAGDLENVEIHEFMDQASLAQISSKADCFVLPSRIEPWGVVVQEFAVAGMPLLISDRCGAADHYCIDHYNGFRFDPESEEDFVKAIKDFIQLDEATLELYSSRSKELGAFPRPEMIAANLYSIERKA